MPQAGFMRVSLAWRSGGKRCSTKQLFLHQIRDKAKARNHIAQAVVRTSSFLHCLQLAVFEVLCPQEQFGWICLLRPLWHGCHHNCHPLRLWARSLVIVPALRIALGDGRGHVQIFRKDGETLEQADVWSSGWEMWVWIWVLQEASKKLESATFRETCFGTSLPMT